MATDAYGIHLCDDCIRGRAQHDLVVDKMLLSLCTSCYKDRQDQLQQEEQEATA